MPIDEILGDLPKSAEILEKSKQEEYFVGVLIYTAGTNSNLISKDGYHIELRKRVPIEYLDKTPEDFKNYILSDETDDYILKYSEIYRSKKARILEDIEYSKRNVRRKAQEYYRYNLPNSNRFNFLNKNDKIIDSYHVRKFEGSPSFEINTVEIIYYINDHR
jgi:hypothetical protein